jgi:putative NADPH-quinone reductase
MKKALVVLCHPNRSGFNHAIAESAVKELKKDHEVEFVDLYRASFDPILPYEEIPRKFSFDETVLNYYDAVQSSDTFVFVHPDWWGGPPALLKGFIDRVFRPGVTYEYEGNEFLSKKKLELLSGKKAFVFTTTDYPEPEGLYPPAEIWKTNVFSYCGIKDSAIYTFFETYHSTFEARHAWIDSIGEKIRREL